MKRPTEENDGMGQIVRHDFTSHPATIRRERHFEPDEETVLRESLKRCSPNTVAAACAFRKSGASVYLGIIVIGIIERYVERDLRGLLKRPDASLRLVEDLGIDSLTMLEIVMLTEEVVGISIEYEELRDLRTLGDVAHFVEIKDRQRQRV
jgi:3-hydroxyacyl-[acyl-carrier-protein] dehydratase